MTSQYPAKIDDNITLPVLSDNSTLVRVSVINELRAAIIGIESALGVNPASVYSTVRQRLDTVEIAMTNIVNGGGSAEITLAGDLSGTSISQTVIGIQGYAISNAVPTDGYILTWNGFISSWEPLEAPVGFSAGGDLSGSATSQIVISLTGLLGKVSIPSASLVFGSLPAADGQIRLENIGKIFARNGADTADYCMLKSSGAILSLGSDENQTLGYNTVNIYPTGITYIGTGGNTRLKVAADGVTIYQYGDPLTFGYTGAADAGIIRIPNNQSIMFRNAGDTGNIAAVTVDDSNNIYVGTDGALANSGSTLRLQSAGPVLLNAGSAGSMYLDGTSINLYQPVIGQATVYGVHGVGTQPMLDSNQTSVSAVYCYNTIKTTGALTANRNLTLPSATDVAAYTKIINNTCTGAFAIVVGTGFGTTATIVNGTTGVVLIDSRGITLVSTPLPSRYELNFASGLVSTTSSTFTRVGGRYVDLSIFPPTIGALARTVTFAADVDMTSGATTVEFRLYDVTHSVAITGADLTSSSTTNIRVTSGSLTVGSSSGNIRNDAPCQYELQLKMNGGGGADAVFLTNSRLTITYA